MNRTVVRQNKLTNVVNFSVVLSDFPMFIRSGHIIALHNVGNSMSADLSRKTEFYLIVALKCIQQDNDADKNEKQIENNKGAKLKKTARAETTCTASGKMQFTENISWNFKATEHEVSTFFLLCNHENIRIN